MRGAAPGRVRARGLGLWTILVPALVGVPEAVAMWEKLTDEQLVAKSELIVRAEVVGTKRLDPGQNGLFVAQLRVLETYKGKSRPEVLLAQPSPEGPISSSDLRYPVASKGLWFLRVHPTSGEVFLADHPQRFTSEANDPQRFEELLKRLRALPPG